jgi:hypothetical protein
MNPQSSLVSTLHFAEAARCDEFDHSGTRALCLSIQRTMGTPSSPFIFFSANIEPTFLSFTRQIATLRLAATARVAYRAQELLANATVTCLLRTQGLTTGTLATEIPLNMETNACAWYTGRDVCRYSSKRVLAEMLSLLLPIAVPVNPPTQLSAAEQGQEEAHSGFTGQRQRTRASQRLSPFDRAFSAYAQIV